ncbi:hypothetical protein VP01_4596g3 [Puccinia sorghi]|uniref:Uncharacterized protein n=1 Tax=Puccinia sorghi TaxID=27349 RepID=A0A0L6UNJ5_9BASI|nr:hypothetical protein VP01_4596g3 [Puccinia sorghi]
MKCKRPCSTPGETNNKIQLSEDPSQMQPEKSVVKPVFFEAKLGVESLQKFLIFLICSLSSQDQKFLVWCFPQEGSIWQTKNFDEHLLKKHHLVNPKINKKVDKAQSDISKYLKNEKVLPKASINSFQFFFLTPDTYIFPVWW